MLLTTIGATVGDSHPHHPCPDCPAAFLLQSKVVTGSVRRLPIPATTGQ
ncbi:hypothetical protein A2U01_0061995 [Trifolium medium]|uniref:Uncharacterized protein n=1 Tax=Trifolium medium TaxID=97028 RepID=A0A392RX77_9FABA|nr:hypothetical protein [Trifolium medium]